MQQKILFAVYAFVIVCHIDLLTDLSEAGQAHIRGLSLKVPLMIQT